MSITINPQSEAAYLVFRSVPPDPGPYSVYHVERDKNRQLAAVIFDRKEVHPFIERYYSSDVWSKSMEDGPEKHGLDFFEKYIPMPFTGNHKQDPTWTCVQEVKTGKDVEFIISDEPQPKTFYLVSKTDYHAEDKGEKLIAVISDKEKVHPFVMEKHEGRNLTDTTLLYMEDLKEGEFLKEYFSANKEGILSGVIFSVEEVKACPDPLHYEK